MDLELYSLMAIIVMLSSVVTVLLAIAAYVMFRLQESRTAREKSEAGDGGSARITKSQFYKPFKLSRST
jgi:hypothetical protein